MKINKGKKKLLAAGLILLFLTVLGVSLLNTNPAMFNGTMFPSTSNNFYQKGSQTGSGGQLNALLTITNNTNSTYEVTDTSSDFNISCQAGWNITYAQIILSNISAPSVIRQIETDHTDSYPTDSLLDMSFNITTRKAYLDNVTVILSVTSLSGGDNYINFWVRNASWDSGNQRPQPSLRISPLIQALLPDTGWQTITVAFNHLTLDTSKTSNNTFFVEVVEDDTSPSGPSCGWRQTSDTSPPSGDGVNEGYAYNWGTSTYLAIDFVLTIRLTPSGTSPYTIAYPEDLLLAINGTQVSNNNSVLGEGICEMTTVNVTSSTGAILFNASSPWYSPVSFNITYRNVTYSKYQTSSTDFSVSSEDTYANWNVTVDVTGSNSFAPGMGENYHNYISLDLPDDWWNSTPEALNLSGGSAPYIDPDPNDDIVGFEATNGTWIVQCGAPNYVKNITVINQDFNVNVTKAILIDNNLNITVALNNTVNGNWNANLTIYNSTNPSVFNNETSGTAGSSFWFPLNVSDDIKDPGTYNISVFFNSSFEVGNFEIVNFQVSSSGTTSLTVNNPPEYVKPPQLANITVGFNRTDINQGITGLNETNFGLIGGSFIDWVDGLGGGVYVLHINFTSEGYHTFRVTVQGVPGYNNATSNWITLLYGVPPPTDITFLLLSTFLSQFQSGRNQSNMLLIFLLVGAVVAVGSGGYVANRRRKIPLKAMASLENILVDHIPTGITLWAFDFFRMEQDVTLVSGFMTAVRTFLGEMQKGGLRKLETEFGTFIREDGAFLTATCITSGNTSSEENWIRRRLRSFLSISEQQNLDALEKWKGDAAPFRKSFPTVLASVIDLDKTEELQRQRILRLENEKERLRMELNNLGSQMEGLSKQVEAKEISKAEFEARTAKIEPEYDRFQNEFIRVSLFLSRAPSKLEAKKVKPEVTEDVEKIQGRFLEIRMEIEELRRKEVEGTITSKDHKRRDKLQTELVSLIEKLDKLQK
nr:hypothetical protein [Candidatus Freyarchaeota archaeon]